ncbi:unnamed protein product [Owenia fusiformis]|uniref:RRM domain-containing protein n=1 Tax=Owenia fusiformis TaxID=6347 RepID=A0A8S4PG81_OWEFU|nr:unnamed protein product [Owenia fusiformis]CAH1792611.1 unnamed protein product [Owenia fusiformis]
MATDKEGYVIGQVSESLSKSAMKKNSQDLSALFNVKPNPPVFEDTNVKKKGKGKQRETKVKELKQKSTAKAKSDLKKNDKILEKSKKSGHERGYSPPPGIVHESLQKQSRKRKKNTLLEEREQEEDNIPKVKKKKKRGQEDADIEGEDEGTKKQYKDRIRQRNHRKDKARLNRTVFVGNLPLELTKKDIQNLFKTYGEIENIRFRGAAPADPKLPKRVAVIKKELHPEKQTMNAYVVYKEAASLSKCLKLNGTSVKGCHIRVDLVGETSKHDHKRSVFIGNLPYNVKEESLREHFDECGDVESVRLVRDAKSGMGKGFGYILFKDSSSVELALKSTSKKFMRRDLRVMRSVKKEKKTDDKISTEKPAKGGKDDKRPQKKFNPASNIQKHAFQGMTATQKPNKKFKKKFKEKHAKRKALAASKESSNPTAKGKHIKF